jgi:hypothetical protein
MQIENNNDANDSSKNEIRRIRLSLVGATLRAHGEPAARAGSPEFFPTDVNVTCVTVINKEFNDGETT